MIFRAETNHVAVLGTVSRAQPSFSRPILSTFVLDQFRRIVIKTLSKRQFDPTQISRLSCHESDPPQNFQLLATCSLLDLRIGFSALKDIHLEYTEHEPL